MLNLKDVIIKDLQVEDQRLHKKINKLEEKVIPLEGNNNSLEQYGRRNSLETTEIPSDVDDQNLEEKEIEILDKTEVNVSSKDIKPCLQVGKLKKLLKNNNRRIC